MANPNGNDSKKSLDVLFSFDRATKNTGRYQEIVELDGEEIIGTLYVQKKALALLGNPQKLRVTVAKEE